MPRLDKTKHFENQASTVGDQADSVNVVPNSFADWLAQPASAIVDGDAPEQGILLDVVTKCPDTSFFRRNKDRQ